MRVFLLTALLSSSAFAGWEYISRSGAQYYGHQFSEENGGWGPSAPARGFTGWKCYGGNCDDKKMRIPTNGDNILAGGAGNGDIQGPSNISEEGGRSTMECGNRLISRLRCRGGNCDNTDVWCRNLADGYRIVRSTEWWSGWFSEEQGPYDCPANYWLWGFQCGGGSCDNQRLRCVRVQKWIPKNCQVSAWGAWSSCSKTCGIGTQKQTRTVTQNPESGGQACPGLEQSQSCQTQPCPIDCVVSGFGEWGACSAECDGGKQTRSKTITTAPQHGGAACPAEMSQEQACNTQPCRDCDGIENKMDDTFIKVKTDQKSGSKKVNMVDEDADPLCECADLCKKLGSMYYSYYVKKDKPTCMCYQEGSLKMKTRSGYQSGYLNAEGKKQMDKKSRRKSNRGRRRGGRRRRG